MDVGYWLYDVLTKIQPISHVKLTSGACWDEEKISNQKLNPSEPPRGKTNNVVSEQVGHKLGCRSTEDS